VAKGGIDLDRELDRLYASPPSEFVSARNALVKTLEVAGRKDDAARVKALKKPNTAAWGVNQLAISAPRVLAALAASGDRLRAKGSDPREAMQKRRDAVHEARREVERAFAGAGQAANPDVLRRVSATLEAIATYGSTRGGPVAGRLTEDVPAPGFDEIASLGLLGAGAPAPRPVAPPARPAEAHRKSAEPDSAKRPKRDEARERKALAERTKKAGRARAGLAAAEKAVDAIRRKKASLEAALSEATDEEKALEAALEHARKALEAADAAERSARETG
jgi:predicted  nucleic acid-binding Zn-ribbon protein